MPPNTNNVDKPQFMFAGVKLHIIYIYIYIAVGLVLC